MKKIFMILASVAMLFPAAMSAKGDGSRDLKIMSYNIRLGTADDGTNSWKYRYPATALMIKDVMPDIFGVQEAFDFQVNFITSNFPEYKAVGVGRDDGKKKGEHMSIFYNKKEVTLLKWGTFWLSDTPEKPSKGWDAACFRSATWALMKHKATGKKFYYVNTHLDHKGKEAQKNGLALIVDKIQEINPKGYPMVLTGDFNVVPTDPVLTDLDKRMSSARVIAKKTDNRSTFNGWGKSSGVIDYIYVSGFSECIEYQTVDKKYGDWRFVSDHFPITATVLF
jgi:endonuclease/exonuclease/phosphatase family metal-dependent hydrolase